MQAVDAPIPETQLWRESNRYTDQPCRMISWCYEHMGDAGAALQWARAAREKISEPDADWDARIIRLNGAPAIVGKAKNVICLRRAGAIGDVLMTLNLLPALKEANPESAIYYFTDPSLAADDALGWIIRAAGADQVMRSNAFEAWQSHARAIDLVGYPLAEGYPDKPMKRHLLQYFAAEMGLTLGDELPALKLRRPRSAHEDCRMPYATYQTKAGWSRYKQWDDKKWEAVKQVIEINLVSIDESAGWTLQEAISVFANARMHIGIDSFANHLTNYLWHDGDGVGRRVPGVILWGSTQASAAGYPTNTNISLGLGCQPCFREDPKISRMPRGPCINPPKQTYDEPRHACMSGISVERVIQAITHADQELPELCDA